MIDFAFEYRHLDGFLGALMLLKRFACRGSGKEGECGANGDRYKKECFFLPI